MRRKRPGKPQAKAAPPQRDRWTWLGPLVLFLATLACYWTPLTSPSASIQWDAADYHQPVQDYLSQELRAGRLPLWTPYLYSGYPFLADPQVGAWYPLNWPFLLSGVPPRAIFAENFLSVLIACFGAGLLARRLVGDPRAAVFAGLAYGLSGFFTGHASHTGMMQTAAWLPWILLFFDRALEENAVRNTALAGLSAGVLILAGYFQCALYSFLALALFGAARLAARPRAWARVFSIAAAIPIVGTLLSAVAVAPGLELAAHSVRSGLSALTRTEGFIRFPSLLTLVYPNYHGALEGIYTGPLDMTQFYFYAGLLLAPLAALGLRNRALRPAGVLLVAIPVWYAWGHSGGLYLFLARLPGFSSIRAPVNIWFVPALGLALLGAAGFAWLARKYPVKWLPGALLLFAACDLFYWNSAANRLLYARAPYDSMYGGAARFSSTVNLPPLTRFDAPERLWWFGPLTHPLAARAEVTYGYNPLALRFYSDYYTAMQSNRKLAANLNVSRVADVQRQAVIPAADYLPRANFPKRLVPVASAEESLRMLPALYPAAAALVPPAAAGIPQDAAATAAVIEHRPGYYRIRYRAASESLLRVAVAWFPGWRARVEGRPVEVHRVDHALLGVAAPAGEHEVVLEYRSTYLLPGAAVSLAALLACLAAVYFPITSIRVATTSRKPA